MPIVEMTMIEGYDAQTKTRLITSLTRAVRSVMAAPPEGVIIVLREVQGGCYARGGTARVPGPPLPSSETVVRDFLRAVSEGNRSAAASYVTSGFSASAGDGQTHDITQYLARATDKAAQRLYLHFHEALTDQGALLIAEDSSETYPRFIEMFNIENGKICRSQRFQ